MSGFYRTHRALLEARRRYWLRQLDNPRIPKPTRDDNRRYLRRTLRELEFGDVKV